MVAIEVPNSLLDFVMMALPISMLRTLRIGMREKIILVLIFAMGAGWVLQVNIISISNGLQCRCYRLRSHRNCLPTWTLYDTNPSRYICVIMMLIIASVSVSSLGMWVAIQQAMGIFCCCFPTYRPFLKHLKLPDSISSRYASFLARTRPSTNKSDKTSEFSNAYKAQYRTDGSYDLGNLGHEESVLTRVEASSNTHSNTGYPLKTVNVERTVEMV